MLRPTLIELSFKRNGKDPRCERSFSLGGSVISIGFIVRYGDGLHATLDGFVRGAETFEAVAEARCGAPSLAPNQ